MTERSAKKRLFSLLAVGGLIHLAISLTLYFLGNYQGFSSLILRGGILAGDAPLYVKRCAQLGGELLAGNWQFLIARDEQIHVRLYAISYAALSPLFGDSALSFELVNLPLFLLAVFLIYKIGETCFDEPVGLRAGALFLLFPTLLAHFSQPLRDALSICLILLFFWLLAKVLKNTLDLPRAALFFAASSVLFFAVWLTRENMLPIYVGLVVITIGLGVVRNLRRLPELKYNFLMLAALLAVCLLIPAYFSRLLPNADVFVAETPEEIENARQAAVKVVEYQQFLKENDVPGYLEKLNLTRLKFQFFYRNAGANIDDRILFRSPADVLAYAPRALQIGLFSPFPEMWFAAGKDVGRTGRLIAGAETLASYILMIFALIALVRSRRNVFVWQIFLTLLLAGFVLGIGVINLGALYRLRYVFWCLLMALAAKGICLLADALKRKTETETVSA